MNLSCIPKLRSVRQLDIISWFLTKLAITLFIIHESRASVRVIKAFSSKALFHKCKCYKTIFSPPAIVKISLRWVETYSIFAYYIDM